MTEADLDLLDTYLDGELSMADSQDLWHRLDRDRELAAALDQLRAERADRQLVWASLEPAELEADAWSHRLTRVMRRRLMMERVTQTLRYAGAAAACVVIGFAMGWNQRSTITVGAPTGRTGVSQVASAAPSDVELRDISGRQIATQHFDTPQEASDFTAAWNNLETVQQQRRDAAIVPVGVTEEQY